MRLGALSAFVALALCGSTLAAFAQQPTPADLVDALNEVFGKHPGDRAAHTKGICLTGSFTPSAEAPKLSKAAHFAKQVPIRARFSLGGGNPKAPDNAQDNVRGFAVKFDLGNGASTDIVTISAPVFFVKTPELFVEFLKTIATGDKDKLNTFFAAHPESTRQNAWLMSHPVPASYAGVAYFGVHGFTFSNPAGERTLVKYKLIPEAGELGLTPDEAKAKGPDFYARPCSISWRSWARRATRTAIPRSDGTMKTTVRRRRLEKSASRRSNRKRPAIPVSSFPEMSQMELSALPMIPSSPCGHQPISCPSRGGRLHHDGLS
jgi:hypothetical protein